MEGREALTLFDGWFLIMCCTIYTDTELCAESSDPDVIIPSGMSLLNSSERKVGTVVTWIL